MRLNFSYLRNGFYFRFREKLEHFLIDLFLANWIRVELFAILQSYLHSAMDIDNERSVGVEVRGLCGWKKLWMKIKVCRHRSSMQRNLKTAWTCLVVF